MNVGKFPKRIEIELSSCCNLCCVYCPRKHLNHLGDFIDEEIFRKIVDEASAYMQTILVLHRRGESLLHPRFVECCAYVKGKFKEIQIATNATLLDDDKAQAIIDAIHFISFSIDVPEVFDKTRIPARYSDVEKRIMRFLELNNKKVRTQVSMVKTTNTPKENIELFKKIWMNKVDRIRIYEEHSIDGVFGSLKNHRKDRQPCVMPSYELLVFADGKIGRCNHDWNGKPIGDLKTQSIADIWSSDNYMCLRKQHISNKFTDEVCLRCDSWYAEVGNQGTGEVVER